MTVTVQASANLGLAKGQNRTCFRNARGLKYYYSFYYDTSNSELRYENSSDGITWGSAAAVTTDDPDCFDVKYHDDGSQMEVWVVWHTGGTTKYRAGTVADAASAITWSAAEQTIDAAISDILAGVHCIAVARTDNDEIVVAFTEDATVKGKDYRFVNLIGSDGSGGSPNWSGEVIWDDPSGNSNNQNKGEVWFGVESFSSSYPDDFLIYACSPTTGVVGSYRLVTAVPDWDQGGAGFTNTTASASWFTNPTRLSSLIDDSDIAHLCYTGLHDINHRKAGSAGDDDFGAETEIENIDPLRLSALTCSLDTGPATDVIYVYFVIDSIIRDFYYAYSPVDVISFSSRKFVSYHQRILALSSWNRVIENSLHIGGQWGTTVIYNEQPVYKALSTTLADLEFPDQNYYLGPHDL